MKQAIAKLTFVLVTLAAAAAGPAALPAHADAVEDQVVRILSTKKEVDRSAPWQFEEVRQQDFLGVVLPEETILTTAYAVADAAFLEMQRFGASRRIELKVVFVDYEVNLALVKPVDTSDFATLKPVQLGDELAIDESVDIYKPRDSYQLSRLGGSLQEAGLFSAVTSTYSLVSYLLKVQQTGLGWSEPVFRGGKLVALTTGQDANFVHGLPVSAIKHFLDDQHNAGYRGFPSIGVELTSLVSPDMRRLLGSEPTGGGVRIAKVLDGSPFSDKLRVGDVLLEVDGTPISEHGFYTHPQWGKVHLKHLINQRFGGDTLKLKIMRQGQTLTIEDQLTRFDSNRTPVVAYRYGEPEPHLIVGGFIFQELSQDYLKQWGKEWRSVAPIELLYALESQNDPTPDPGQRVIFVTRVLADDFNRGYSEFRQLRVASVNGLPVTSMASLRAALGKPVSVKGRQFVRMNFTGDGGEAILAYDGLAAAHQRIAKTYEVKNPASFYTATAP